MPKTSGDAVSKRLQSRWFLAAFHKQDRPIVQGPRSLAGWQSPDFDKEEWALDKEMGEKVKVLIAKARWIYHCERCKIDQGKRKRMNIEIVMQRLDRRMKIVDEASKKAQKK